MTKQRVNNELYLERETSSGTILNTDKYGYDALMENKRRKMKENDSLRNEIDELRNLVNALLMNKGN